MEELGIGRPSTYASTLQTLKDRAYVRLEKNRFIPEEKGRLVTAFLERFFERYVSYDFTAELEESLDDVSGGRAQWQKVLEARSEEHTSELQSLMRNSYAVFCLKKKTKKRNNEYENTITQNN